MTRKDFATFSLEDIRDLLLKTYTNQEPRRMFVHKSQSGNGGLGAVFFAIEGTPPKGFGIFSSYNDNRGVLYVYNSWGKRISIYGDATVQGLDKIGDVAIIEKKR